MKTRRKFPVLCVALTALALSVLSQEVALTQINRIEKSTLESGATLLTKVNPSSEIVALRVYFPGGPLYESPEQSGITNMVLRMLQAGTEKRNAAQIANEIDSIGAEMSSDVNKDYGGMLLKTTRLKFDAGLEILLDCLFSSKFPEDRLENERKSIIYEIRQERDNLLSEAFRVFQSNLYGEHPYGKPSVGTEESVAGLKREEIIDFYERSMIPTQMLFVVVGNFDPTNLKKTLNEAMKSIQPGYSERKPPAAPEASVILEENHREIIERQSDSEWLIMGYPAPEAGDELYATFKVINSIMGGSMDSRLFAELREKKHLAYQVGSLYPSRRQPSFYGIYMGGVAPGNHAVAVEGILAEVEKIQQEPVSLDELERAKTFIRGTFVMSQETNMGQASLYGLFEMIGLGAEYVDRYPDDISSVTVEGIQKAARKYLNTYSLAAIQPEAQPVER